MSSAVRAAILVSRSNNATAAPSAAKVKQMARPMFDAPPVTTTTRPLRPTSMSRPRLEHGEHLGGEQPHAGLRLLVGDAAEAERGGRLEAVVGGRHRVRATLEGPL